MTSTNLKNLSLFSRTEFIKKISLYALGITFFFCVASYNGIVTDATLYTIQAIHSFQPERFTGDIVFLYGNQDSFTIFSPFYTFFLKIFSIEKGAKIVCFLSHLIFCIATLYLIDSWTKKFHCNTYFFPIALMFISLYCKYGESIAYINKFYYLESYVTPRTISVAFGLLGLAKILTKKYTSIFLFIIGSIFHPLMAGWGIPIWMFFYYPKTIVPVSICSLLFPLTLFLDKGALSVYDPEWGPFFKQSHTLHFLCFISFFVYCWKYSQRKLLQQLSKALIFTISIAVYWFVASQKTGHILLTQVQTFRIEWLCVATTFPLFCIILHEKFTTTFRKNKKYKLADLVVLIFPLVFWIDSLYLDALFLFVILELKVSSSLKSRWFYNSLVVAQISCAIWMFIIVIIQQQTSYTEAIYLQKYEFYPALLLAILTILKYIIQPSLSKLSIFSLLIIFVCNLTQVDSRFTENISNIPTLLSATFLCTTHFYYQRSIRLIPLLWLLPFALTHYDQRLTNQIYAEKQINLFFEQPIFPEISNRGHILFCLDGFFNTQSRIQFLSGNYLDFQSQTGSLFYKGQHIQSEHRFRMLFYQDSSNTKKIVWDDFSVEFQKLHEINRLNQTMTFLCSTNEVTHLVTDIPNLDFQVLNSQKNDNFQKEIYLYSCNK